MSEGLDHTSSTSESKKQTSFRFLYTVIGAIVGIAVVRIFRAGLFFHGLGGAFGGFLVGLIPFFIAKKRGDEKLARLAIGICTLSGVILGLLLAIPVCIVFVVIILLTRQRKENTYLVEQSDPDDWEHCDTIKTNMTPEQIAEGQKRSREIMESLP